MKGRYDIVIQNSLVQFKFTVNRNITIIRGDSATGKTTLVDMVRQYSIGGVSSGVTISCEKECTVLTGLRWESEIAAIRDSIVFIDEGFEFISSDSFAEAIRKSDNYYVLATRETLPNLPYSIREIYGLKNVTRRSKYQEYDRIYSEFYPLYDDEKPSVPELLIVEDTNAGYEFFRAICEKVGIECVSANGKSNIYNTIRKCEGKTVLVVADGAAFGPEMERVFSLRKAKRVMFYLPESFEWLILKSGLIDGNRVMEILDHPYDHIISEKYFSWERFFSALLVEETEDTYLKYKKSKLNKNYLNDENLMAIKAVISEGTDDIFG